ncbi:MAG: hypothetical protein U1E52_09335 [Geminicoccaceae bacterium]
MLSPVSPPTGSPSPGSGTGSDPYVFAVPRGLDLGCVIDPDWDLTAEQQRLNRTMQFNFGNLHNQRVDEWYRRVLPRHRVAAWCRTYRSALALVRRGSASRSCRSFCAARRPPAFDVDLHAVPKMDRPIVALVPTQHRRAQPFAVFLECLRQAAAAVVLPPLGPAPPFLGRSSEASDARSRRGRRLWHAKVASLQPATHIR